MHVHGIFGFSFGFTHQKKILVLKGNIGDYDQQMYIRAGSMYYMGGWFQKSEVPIKFVGLSITHMILICARQTQDIIYIY